jgi:hypothetical protein
MDRPTAQNSRDLRVRNWLLALLRFSVTLEPADQAAVMAIADEMDRLGFVSKKPEFSFFLRTTTDVCNAIADWEKSGRNDILRLHLARIDDRRLRRAFLAVFDLESQGDQSAPQDRRPAVLRSVQSKKRA